MTGFIAVLLTVLTAWNPPLVAERTPAASHRRTLGMALAAAVVVGVAAFAGPMLDALDVSVPTFRTAAGTVLAVTGARWLIGPGPQGDEGDEMLLGVIDIATPAIVFTVVATTAASGWWPTAISMAGAAGFTAWAQSIAAPVPVMRWLRRLLAGGAVGLGVVLIYAGIRAV